MNCPMALFLSSRLILILPQWLNLNFSRTKARAYLSSSKNLSFTSCCMTASSVPSGISHFCIFFLKSNSQYSALAQSVDNLRYASSFDTFFLVKNCILLFVFDLGLMQ